MPARGQLFSEGGLGLRCEFNPLPWSSGGAEEGSTLWVGLGQELQPLLQDRSLPPLAVDKYIAMAKEKHGYNIEQVSLGPEGIWAGARTVLGAAEPELSPFTGQALGMLLWHKHDVEKSLADLANFTPFPDEWTVEDKVLFEQAFGFHGKCFQRIQQMVKPSAPAVAPQPLLSDEPARGPDSRVAPASGVAPPAA